MKRLLALFLGVLAQFTMVTAPIHEIGHWLLATIMGVHATITWNTTTFYGYVSRGQYFALCWSGVTFETAFFLVMSMLTNRKKKDFWTWLFMAAALTSFLTAATYTDMAAVHYRGLKAWYIIGTVVFLSVIWKMTRVYMREVKTGIIWTTVR